MEFLYEYGLFLLKAITIVVATLAIVGGIVNAASKNKQNTEGEIQIRNISEEIVEVKKSLQKEILSKDALNKLDKDEKKKKKEKTKAEKKKVKEELEAASGNLFVLEFEGDIKASAVENLREEISAFLTIAKPGDSVLLRLDSSGGMVHSYGFAASQLVRIKDAGFKLVVAVDQVAASGGYMMACVADKIIAAPFAILGSIGVLAQIPNFNRLLRKHDIDYEQHTAGDYKRTLTVFGENTEQGREKFKQEIEETHQLFKVFVKEQRPSLDIDSVATGETWYGKQALDNVLIDELQTSDDYIMKFAEEHSVYALSYEFKKPLAEKLGLGVAALVDKAVHTFFSKQKRQELAK